jgi:hypothetical protein
MVVVGKEAIKTFASAQEQQKQTNIHKIHPSDCNFTSDTGLREIQDFRRLIHGCGE